MNFSSQESDSDLMDDSALVIKLNVGGRLFTTTRQIVMQSPFFQRALGHRSNKSSSSVSPSSGKERHFVRMKNRTYFVDRNPDCFRDILEYLRTGKANPLEFMDSTEHPARNNHAETDRKQTDGKWCAPLHNFVTHSFCYLIELREEAIFFELNDLVVKISECLAIICPKSTVREVSWLDVDAPHHGIRKVIGTRIAFAITCDNYCRPDTQFDPPRGFRWASQAEYLSEYSKSIDALSHNNEWIHFNVGGWNEYTWKFTLNFAFLFRDSFLCGRFVHAGMKLNDISHVSLFSMHTELIDCDDQKGIQEGFAGLVLIADDVLDGTPPPMSVVSPMMTAVNPASSSHPVHPTIGPPPSSGIDSLPPARRSSSQVYDPQMDRTKTFPFDHDEKRGAPPEMARLSSRPTREMAEQMILQKYGNNGVDGRGGNGGYDGTRWQERQPPRGRDNGADEYSHVPPPMFDNPQEPPAPPLAYGLGY